MKTQKHYYIPMWMEHILQTLLKEGLVQELDFTKKLRKGYKFDAPYGDFGDDRALTKTLVVWDAGAKEVQDRLRALFPHDASELVHTAEEYARERVGRKDTYVCRCIVQLLIAKAVELSGKEHPERTLVISGDFSLIGRLPEKGRLQINGAVEKVEGWAGALLEIKAPSPPRLDHRRSEYDMVSSVHKLKDGWVVVTEGPPDKFYC